MYRYIVERTQIYLSREQADILDREAKRTGTTRSHLIREAIAEKYGTQRDTDAIEAALRETAGTLGQPDRRWRRLRRAAPDGTPLGGTLRP